MTQPKRTLRARIPFWTLVAIYITIALSVLFTVIFVAAVGFECAVNDNCL